MGTLKFYLINKKHLDHLEFICASPNRIIRKLKLFHNKIAKTLLLKDRNRKAEGVVQFSLQKTIGDFILIPRKLTSARYISFYKELWSETPIKRTTINSKSNFIEFVGTKSINPDFKEEKLAVISKSDFELLYIENKISKKGLGVSTYTIDKDRTTSYYFGTFSIDTEVEKINLLEVLEENGISSEEFIIDLTIQMQCTA